MSFLGSLIYGYRYIQSVGATLAQRSYLNFTGSGVTVTDNASTGATDVTITAGGAGSVPTASYPSTSLEAYQGGIGAAAATNDAAAVAAFAALTTLGGGVLLLRPGTYATTGITVPPHCGIIGQGDVSTLETTTNAPAITLTNARKTLLKDFRILGSSTGVLQVGIQNGQTGVASSGDGRAVISNVSIENMGSDGIQVYQQDTTIAGVYNGTRILGCRIEGCGVARSAFDGHGYAVYVGNVAEYVVVSAPNFNGNFQGGVYVGSGNFSGGGGGNVTGNTEMGIEVVAAANDGHGEIVGWNINHNGHAIYTHGIANGFDFVGNHIIGGDIMLGDGTIGGNVGVTFTGGEIDVSNIYHQGSTGTRFLGVKWPGNYTNTQVPNSVNPSTQYFDCNNTDLLGNVPAAIATGGVGWTPRPGQTAVAFASDANKTLTAAEYTKDVLAFTSVNLTATRNAVLPLTAGARWTVYNNTTGAQSIQLIGPTGTGVTVANGKRAIIECDGTNFVRITADV